MNARQADADRPVISRYLAAGLLLVILLTVTCMAMLQQVRYAGLGRPIRIHGSSMAPSLLGEHLEMPCEDCTFPIRMAIDLLSEPEFLTCPNCGYEKNPREAAVRQPGERVLIDRWSRMISGLDRWQLVAFQKTVGDSPGARHTQLTVKRVIGRPGEEVSLQEGEIYIDGIMVRKSMQQFREMAVPLFDTYYRPRKTPGLVERFQSAEKTSRWQRLGTGYQFDDTDEKKPDSASPEDLDQLVYQHWACMAEAVPARERTAVSPIYDHYTYNHGQSRGPLMQVHDLLFQGKMTMQNKGLLVVSLFSRGDIFEVALDTRRRLYELRRNSRALVRGRFYHDLDRGSHELEFAVVDRQMILAVNGKTWCRQSFIPGKKKSALSPTHLNPEHPLAVAARGLSLQVQRIRLSRDLHWIGPDHRPGPWKWHRLLKPREFFVMGDNVPISDDSRYEQLGISKQAIIGKILRFEH
jgi:signal peptidase I